MKKPREIRIPGVSDGLGRGRRVDDIGLENESDISGNVARRPDLRTDSGAKLAHLALVWHELSEETRREIFQLAKIDVTDAISTLGTP